MTNSFFQGRALNNCHSEKATLAVKPELPWLAPLAGYSNLPFRLLCRELGAYVACTEMVSSKGIFYSLNQGHRRTLQQINTEIGKGTWALLASPMEDNPLVIQLFGAEADIMQVAAETIIELFSGREIYFDLNMGCSVPKVVKTKSGAAMLEDLPNALQVAKSLISVAGPGKVGFKLRLGWLKGDDVYLDLAKQLEAVGAGWICLHPRYGKQSFTGKADWQKIAILKQNISIPVVASGDLLTAQAAKDCLMQTGADAVMFARGAMNNPFIFREFKELMEVGKISPPNLQELFESIKRHRELARLWLGDNYALSQMRGFIPRYLHHFPGVRALRQSLSACQTWSDVDIVISKWMLVVKEIGV